MAIEPLYQLFLGAALGALIGVERSFFRKQAGMRTFALVGLGATLFSLIAAQLGIVQNEHLLANIVVGIGFIGAGIIFHQEEHLSGVTTASALWVTAAIGAAVGQRLYLDAFAVTLLAVLILAFLPAIERHISEPNT